MSLKCLFMTIVIVSLSNTAFGDGPPMDKNGNITEDHTVIILNEEQLDQVDKFRVLTLTDKQHEHLKKICTIFPKTIWTLTPHYRLCTCEKIYGIWNKRDQVGIPHNMMNYSCMQSYVEYHSKSIERSLQLKGPPSINFWRPLVIDESWCLTLTIDHKGNIYYIGGTMKMTDIENVISKSPEPKGREKNTIHLSPPPSIDEETDKTINALIEHIRNAASKKGINVVIGLTL